jgi:hypothetical protein
LNPLPQKIVVLLSGAPTGNHLIKVLDRFEVRYELTTKIDDVLSLASTNETHVMMGHKEYLEVSDVLRNADQAISSIFVHEAGTIEIPSLPGILISDRYGDLCGEFAGLSFAPAGNRLKYIEMTDEFTDVFMSAGAGSPVYLRKIINGCELFMSATGVQDIDGKVQNRNDIVKYSAGIVPVLMYLKHVNKHCFGEPEKLACVIIDDPLLHPEYGYLKYRKIISLMEEFGFFTTIAFIPWNYKNTDRQTADLFRENKDKLSICVHGCDHTREEYSSNDVRHLNNITKIAKYRMMEHEKSTGVAFDQVMVFPQGRFSRQAMDSLKENGYWAAINTSPISTNLEKDLELKDLLGAYVGRYGGFPLFTRNTPDEIFGISFNLFLNKPAFIVIHHDFLKDNYLGLINAVKEMNSRTAGIRWDGAGNIVRKVLIREGKNTGHAEMDINVDGVVGNKKKTSIFIRRHASVFRDNYLSKNRALMATYNYLNKVFRW